jgi:hypothetical protein
VPVRSDVGDVVVIAPQRVNGSSRPRTLSRSAESEIVLDHRVRPDRYSARIRQIKLAKDNLVAPNLAKEILEDVNRQLFARTPPVAEAERSEAGIIANRMTCAIDNPEHRAETAIGDVGLAPVFHLEIGDIERTLRQADLPAFVIVDLGTGGNLKIPLRIERIRVFPVDRIQAGAGVRRADVAVPFQWHAELLLWRRAVGACSGVMDS